MERPDADSRTLNYQRTHPKTARTAPMYSILVSLVPHVCIPLSITAGLDHWLDEFTIIRCLFESSLVLSVIAVVYYSQRRRTWLAILGTTIHVLWIVLALIAVLFQQQLWLD